MKKFRRNFIFHILTLILLSPMIVGLEGCVTNPATGENEFSLLSREEEIALGQQGDAEIVAQFGVYDDPEIAAWVNDMGQRIAAKSDDPDLEYTFRVLDTDVINAFALPGGYVYVTRGLLAHLQNDAQLAMILGHEIGHITARHSAKQYTNQVLAQVGLGLGGAIFEDLRPFLGAAQVGLELLLLKYSRDNETQSDTLGIRYASAAGYDASEGADFFVTLQRLQEESESVIPTWTSTHPNPADREENIIAKAAKWQAEHPEASLGGINPEVYLPRLNDMIFGVNRRHGFVANNTFYHPDLEFQFPVPSGWQYANFASQVQMAPENGEAVVVLTTANGVTPDAAASQFQNQEGVQTIEKNSTTVNGFSAVRLRTNVQTEDGTLGVLSYFIRKDQLVYVFHGYTTSDRFGTYSSTFENIFTNFRRITDAGVLAVQPFRLDVFAAPRTDAFSSLVQVRSGTGLDLNGLAILNQRQTGEQVTQGEHLKQVD